MIAFGSVSCFPLAVSKFQSYIKWGKEDMVIGERLSQTRKRVCRVGELTIAAVRNNLNP